jgi:hypothetical protein
VWSRVKSALRGIVADVPIDLGTVHGNRPRSGDRQLNPRACDGNNFERQVATWNYDLFANPSAEDEHSISPEQVSDTFFPTRDSKIINRNAADFIPLIGTKSFFPENRRVLIFTF